MNKLKLLVYLLWRYKIILWPWSVTDKSSNGNYSVRIFNNGWRLNKVYVNFKHPKWWPTFLHEVGHIVDMYRYENFLTLPSVLKQELAASEWAVKFIKLSGIGTQQDVNYLCWCYGTYVGHYCQDKHKADESYRSVKLLGVRYD